MHTFSSAYLYVSQMPHSPPQTHLCCLPSPAFIPSHVPKVVSPLLTLHSPPCSMFAGCPRLPSSAAPTLHPSCQKWYPLGRLISQSKTPRPRSPSPTRQSTQTCSPTCMCVYSLCCWLTLSAGAAIAGVPAYWRLLLGECFSATASWQLLHLLKLCMHVS